MNQEITLNKRLKGTRGVNPEGVWCVVDGYSGKIVSKFRSYGSATNFVQQNNRKYFRMLKVKKCDCLEKK